MEYLYLTTTGWKTGRQHEIEIWFVAHDERYYLVSEKYEQSHWVINIRHNPAIVLRVGERDALPVHGLGRVVDAVAEPTLAERVCALMEAKYGWSTGTIVELAANSG